MRSFILIAIIFIAGSVYCQDPYLLAGTYTKGDSKGIYVYKFNSKTGDLTEVATQETENPSYLASSKDNRHVYAVNENGDDKGAVSAFDFDDGQLKFINKQSSYGDHPCHVSVDKNNKWVVVGNYSGGTFSVYPVNPDGGLGTAVQTIHHHGSSVNKSRQEKAHVHSVVFSPDQKILAVTDLGTDKIMLYPFDADKAKPVNEKPFEVQAQPGSGPRHILFHPERPFAYVIEELTGKVDVYRYQHGKLYHLQKISSHPADYKGSLGSAAIRLSPDARYLYASNRGESNTIAVFAVEPSVGQLRLRGFQKTGGEGPRDFILDPSGNFLLTTNAQSNNITVFKRNPRTGLLQDTGKKVSIPSPVCLSFIPTGQK